MGRYVDGDSEHMSRQTVQRLMNQSKGREDYEIMAERAEALSETIQTEVQEQLFGGKSPNKVRPMPVERKISGKSASISLVDTNQAMDESDPEINDVASPKIKKSVQTCIFANATGDDADALIETIETNDTRSIQSSKPKDRHVPFGRRDGRAAESLIMLRQHYDDLLTFVIEKRRLHRTEGNSQAQVYQDRVLKLRPEFSEWGKDPLMSWASSEEAKIEEVLKDSEGVSVNMAKTFQSDNNELVAGCHAKSSQETIQIAVHALDKMEVDDMRLSTSDSSSQSTNLISTFQESEHDQSTSKTLCGNVGQNLTNGQIAPASDVPENARGFDQSQPNPGLESNSILLDAKDGACKSSNVSVLSNISTLEQCGSILLNQSSSLDVPGLEPLCMVISKLAQRASLRWWILSSPPCAAALHAGPVEEGAFGRIYRFLDEHTSSSEYALKIFKIPSSRPQPTQRYSNSEFDANDLVVSIPGRPNATVSRLSALAELFHLLRCRDLEQVILAISTLLLSSLAIAEHINKC